MGDGKKDDEARAFINSRTCEQLRVLSISRISDLINDMLKGKTGDEDEEAILKLLECMDNSSVGLLNQIIPPQKVVQNFHGIQQDKLFLRYRSSGTIGFDKLTSSASVMFINETPDLNLGFLPVDDIKFLIKNMFNFKTGDAQEQAILKLLEAVKNNDFVNGRRKLTELFQSPGFEKKDFDREFHGDEQDEFDGFFASF